MLTQCFNLMLQHNSDWRVQTTDLSWEARRWHRELGCWLLCWCWHLFSEDVDIAAGVDQHLCYQRGGGGDAECCHCQQQVSPKAGDTKGLKMESFKRNTCRTTTCLTSCCSSRRGASTARGCPRTGRRWQTHTTTWTGSWSVGGKL